MKKSDRNGQHANPEKILKMLLDEVSQPVAPWKPGLEQSFVSPCPHNFVTNRVYDGWTNYMCLKITMKDLGISDGGFLTENQANSLGIKIKKDAEPTSVYFVGPMGYFCKTYDVYSVSQTVDFKRPVRAVHTWDPIAKVEDLVKKSQARVIHDPVLDVPHYDVDDDAIFVPTRERFFGSSEYYQTVLHELAHWTGHSSRLKRDLLDACHHWESRAREELQAEIASFMLGMEYGIGHDPQRSVTYLGFWRNFLKYERVEFERAVGNAMKICRFLRKLGRTPKKQKSRTQAASP